jgi:hypothetical protein
MSITISTDVFCDGEDCLNWTQGVTGRRAATWRARDAAKQSGWVHRKGRDLCPACAKKEKANG